MAYTISKLIEGRLFGVRLVAGHQARENVIHDVNVIDNPDSYDWFKSGDFLLTTGYIYLGDEKGQIELVRKLHEMGCAGLGVKIKRYWAEVPKRMLEEADRLNLPILEFPLDYTLAQISNHINEELISREDSLIRQHLQIHDGLLSCALLGGSLVEVTRCLAEMVKNPIIILDQDWSLVEYAEAGQVGLQAWPGLKLQKGMPILPDLSGLMPEDIASYRKAVRRNLSLPGARTIELVTVPVRIEQITYGYIVCPILGSDLDHLALVALEQAVTVIALERNKEQQFEDYKRMIRYDFFDDLIEGRVESKRTVAHLAELHGMRIEWPHLVVIIKVQDSLDPGAASMLTSRVRFLRLISELTGRIEQLFVLAGRRVTIFQRGQSLVLFIQLSPEETEAVRLSPAGQLIARVYQDLETYSDQVQLSFGVGRVAKSIAGISQSYHEASEALRIQNFVRSDKTIAWYDKLMVYRLLESGIPQEVLLDYYETSLGKLVAYDRENDSGLIEVLQAYIASDGNTSLTADRLYMHRNTMLNRIKKIEEILKVDLKDWDQVLELQLAFYIEKIIRQRQLLG